MVVHDPYGPPGGGQNEAPTGHSTAGSARWQGKSSESTPEAEEAAKLFWQNDNCPLRTGEVRPAIGPVFFIVSPVGGRKITARPSSVKTKSQPEVEER